jgi:hypothetical protein
MNGLLKTNVKKQCSVCGCERKFSYQVLTNEVNLEKSKTELKNKAKKPYMCKVCKSIVKAI